jgi:type I restriction enzyme S subunit
MKVPLPPLHIQEQIADTLDKADALRRKDQELLEKYDELAQAIFYDMFGDPVRNERGWECRILSDLAEIIMGQSPPGETYNSEGLGDPLLNGPTEFGELHPVEKQWTTSPTKYCKKNDILFCVRGATAGKLNVADKEYCIGRGLAAIRPKEDTLFSYIYLYLSNMYDVFQKTSDGSTFINISGDRLKSLSIPLLPEADLAKFQKMSQSLQECIRVAKKSTEKGTMYFNGLMNNHFS